MKAVVAAFNQEKALVGAFSVITNLRMELFEALVQTHDDDGQTADGVMMMYSFLSSDALSAVDIDFDNSL